MHSGKAYEGNTTALGKLGVGIDATELKSMSFDEVTKALSATFEGQATKQAETFAGKMDRLKVAFDEGKETVGSFVLDAITPLVTIFVDKVVPLINTLATDVGQKLGPTFSNLATIFQEDLLPIIQAWWSFLVDIVIPGIVATVQPIIEGLLSAFSGIAKSIKNNEDNLKPLFELFKTVATFVYKTLGPAIGEVFRRCSKGCRKTCRRIS